jgi:hypothetical protein
LDTVEKGLPHERQRTARHRPPKILRQTREGWFQWQAEDFKNLPETGDFDAVDLFRACDQLAEHGLIKWEGLQDGQGQTIGGDGNISAFGVDVIEGDAKSRYPLH